MHPCMCRCSSSLSNLRRTCLRCAKKKDAAGYDICIACNNGSAHVRSNASSQSWCCLLWRFG